MKISFFVLLTLFSFFILFSLFSFNEQSTKFDSSINKLCDDSDSLIQNSNSRYFDNSFPENFESLYSFRNGISKTIPEGINIITPNAQQWYRNLEAIAKSQKEIWDPDKFKDNFDAKVVIKNNDFLCTMNGKIRFTGDYADHILEKDNMYISSLEVSLNEGNILQNRKFKLLLPRTRQGENEIFMTSIFQELGFLAPTTFFVEINFNGDTNTYLFQEKINAEFLQNNNLKEGPLLESDTPPPYEWDDKSIDLARIVNETWLRQNDINFQYGYEALEIYSKLRIFHDQNNNSLIDLNYERIDTISASNLRQFFLLNVALQNYHSLQVDDRKYYIDPQNDLIVPIYYDGGSHFLNTKNINYRPFTYAENEDYGEIILNTNYLKEIQILKQKINQVDINKLVNLLQDRGLSKENIDFIQNNLIEELLLRLDLIELEISNNHIKKENSVLDYFQKSEENLNLNYVVFKDGENFQICSTDLIDCFNTSLSQDEQIQLLNGRLKIDNKKAYFVSESLDSLYYQTPINEMFKFKENIYGINVFSNQIINYEINNKSRFIEIKPQNQSKYLIINSELDNVTIILSYDESSKLDSENNFDKARYDETFYTGCLNIYDSYMKNLSIKVTNSPCEDSVNVVRSKGFISSLEINGSKFDSIDADFSEILFVDTLILNSGNDCVDVSMGKYTFEKLNLQSCFDKGISIGESSLVKIEEMSVSNSYVGVAVKDSSEVDINIYELTDTEYCYATYRKKEEFGPSKLKINKVNCYDSKIFSQSDSYIVVDNDN
jgi:hypothetical protein